MNAGLALLISFETAYDKIELAMFKASSQKAYTLLTYSRVWVWSLVASSSHGCQSENSMGVLNLLFPSPMNP